MATMSKVSAFSMFAETTEEFIQLECARRRNQASLKHRSSRFHTTAHKSRLKEKLAQTRRYEFLLSPDNKASLLDIADQLRELGNNGEEAGGGGKTLQCTGPSPLERDRFTSWAADVEKLLIEFEPSEIHDNDPLVRIVERLQFLQDGHVCLAEAAMDARSLLERWDRAGVFDSESSSEEDEDENDETNIHFQSSRGFLPPDPVKENLRHLKNSYAYQSVRQRAAASIIKRNVLIWVRSKASFCERVAEIEIFGRTTEALLKELRLTTNALSGVDLSANTDLFALGRYDPKSRYGASIAFKDLLQFSKHMALYPVDQALRTVEDVTRRRYLFDSRCAMKIQAVWRRVGDSVRARRRRRAVEELSSKREKEAQAKRDAAKDAKRGKASESGKRKVTKAMKRSSTKRASLISSAVSKLASVSTAQSDETPPEPSKDATPPASQESALERKHSPPVPPIDTSNRRVSTRGKATEDKQMSPTSTPRRRQRASQFLSANNNNDSDDDTTDVEAAWKTFMDTVAADLAEEEVLNEIEETTAPDVAPVSDPMPSSLRRENWEAWSDDEIEVGDNEKVDETSMPIPLTPTTPRIKVVVSVNKSGVSEAAARLVPRKEYKPPRRNQTRPQSNPTGPVIRPPSSLPFDATLQNHTGPYTGAGQLSLMAPFIDADRSKKPRGSVVTERKHLYELDFSGTERMDASFVHAIQALGKFHEPEEQQVEARPKTPEEVIAEVPRTISRQTTVTKLRGITGDKEQRARVRTMLGPKNQEVTQSNDRKYRTSPSGGISTQPGYFIYGGQGMKVRREVVLRKGSRAYSPQSARPEKETANSVDPDSKEIKAWHRSTIAAIPKTVRVPHPPVDRFRSNHKRRMKDPLGTATDTTNRKELIDPPAKKFPKRTEKRNELLLLLRRSRAAARLREIEDPLPDDNEDHIDIPAPDANKQMWKRSGELPELALAQIRDRIGYKPRSSHPKRMSIIAGRAPPVLVDQSDGNNTLTTVTTALDEQPETIFPVDEESEDTYDDDFTENEDDYESESDSEDKSLESGGVDQTNDRELQGVDSVLNVSSDELSDELRSLLLASRERELGRHRSLLAHLQSEEDFAAEDAKPGSKEVSPQHQNKRRWPRHRNKRRSVRLINEESDVVTSDDVEVSVWHHRSSDEDAYAHTRRRLRVKTRDAKRGPFEELSNDDEDNPGKIQDEVVRIRLGMTQEERDAAFQKLLTQYLGLLQCAPAEVARRLQVS